MAGVIKVKWSEMKLFTDTRGLSIQYVELLEKYLLTVIDSPYTLFLEMDRNPSDTTELLDFETNYKPTGNGRVREESFTTDRRLRVDSAMPSSTIERVESWGPKLVYADMNVLNGGIARGTTVLDTAFSTLYSYTGSGLIEGFVTTLEKIDDGWEIKLTVDGVEIFGANGINTADMDSSSLYNFDINKEIDDRILGLDLQKNTLRWEGPMSKPIKFLSSVSISAKRVLGEGSKKFKAGMVVIHKES